MKLRRGLKGWAALGVAASVFVVACESKSTDLCEPKATIACDCADGTKGAGVCSADGKSFGVCACGMAACNADLFSDPNNCGACGHACDGGECANAQCLPVSLSTEPAGDIAVTSDGVFYTTGDSTSPDGAIKKMPIAGGAATTLAMGQAFPHSLVVDATRAVWVQGNAPYGVWTVPIGGGTPTAIVPDVDVYRVVTDATNVYWASGKDVMKAALSGGAPVTLATAADCQPLNLAVDAKNVYFTCASDVSPSFDTVHAVPIAGGADSVIVNEPDQFGNAIVVTGGTLAWTLQSGLHSAPVGGGMPTTLVEGLDFAEVLVTDGSRFYVNSYGGWITSVPIGGGRPVVIAEQLDASPGDMAVLGASLYVSGKSGIQRIRL